MTKLSGSEASDPFDTPSSAPSSGQGNADEKSRIVSGRYRLPDPDPADPNPAYKRLVSGPDAGYTSWMRATRLAGAISDSFALSQWSQRHVVHGLVLRPSLYALAATLHPEHDKDEMDALTERAKEAAQAKDSADLGTAVHAFTEAMDRHYAKPNDSEAPVIPAPYQADVDAWSLCLRKHGIGIVPHLIERVVVVNKLGVAGKWDRVGILTRDMDIDIPGMSMSLRRGTHVIIDLKTGRDLRYAWHEIAIQLALYAHADWIWNWNDAYLLPPFNLDRSVGFVVHLPVGTGQATLHAVDLTAGWEAAQLAGLVLRWRSQSGLSTPVPYPRDRARAERAAAMAAALEAVQTAPDVATLRALHQALAPKGMWTGAIAQASRVRHLLLLKR